MRYYSHGGDIYRQHVELDFSVNLNPFGMPENVKQAIADHVAGYEAYPDFRSERLCKALAVKEQVPAENILCGNGATELIYQLVLSQKPKRALILAPAFSEYAKALQNVKCDLEHFVLKEKNGFDFTPEEEQRFLKQLENKYDMVFIANPSNPCGITLKENLIYKICSICRKNQTIVLLDECFLEFTETTSFVKEISEFSNLFLLKAFTKNYSMAGLRLGYGICKNADIIEEMRRFAPCWNVSAVAQVAGEAALKNYCYMDKTRQYLEKERKYMKTSLIKLGFNNVCGEANYLFFKGIPRLKERMLEKYILIRCCDDYYGIPEGYYRIAVKKHEDNVRLIACLKEIVNG